MSVEQILVGFQKAWQSIRMRHEVAWQMTDGPSMAAGHLLSRSCLARHRRLLLAVHFMLGSSRVVCQGLGRKMQVELQRQLWPPLRPSSALPLPQRTRLSQATSEAAQHQAVVYQESL